MTIRYVPERKRTFRCINQKATLILRGRAIWCPDRFGSSFKVWEVLHMEADEPQSLSWFVGRLGLVCSLLSLFTDELVAPVEVQLPSNTEDDFDTWLLYRPVRASKGDDKTIFPMIGFDDVEERLATVLDQWLSPNDTLHEAIALFLDARYRPRLTVDSQFLLLAQSIEAFGRATVGGEYVSEEEFKPIRKALTEAIPPTVELGHREALKNRIRYGYQHSLRKRIETLFGTLKPLTAAIVCANQEAFVEKVVNMRHYLSHRTDELRELATDGADLYWTCEQLMLLLRLLLLKHFGLEEDMIVDRLQKGHRTSQVIAKWKKRAKAAKQC